MLIADEPTTALDVTTQAGILELMRDIRERLGTAIVLITHDLGVVADIADRVLVLYAGRKAEEAPTAELFAEPQHPYTIAPARRDPAAVESDGRRRRLREIPGRVPSLRELPTGVRVRRPLPARGRPRAQQVPELATVRARPPRRVLPPGARMTDGSAPALEVVDLVKHYRVGAGITGGGAVVHAVDGVSFALRPGRDARPRRRVGQRQVDDREVRPAARSSRPRARSGCTGPTSRTCRGARCGRSGASCTSSSRIRSRRSTRG